MMISISRNKILRTAVTAALILFIAAAVSVLTKADAQTSGSLQIDTVTAAARIQSKSANATTKKVTIKKVSSDKKGQITVKWKKVSGADKYQIAYRVKGGGKDWKIKTVDASSLQTTIKNRKVAEKYAVKVRAVTKSGGKTRYGKWSEKKYVRVCNGKVVYLTFDDGPSKNMERILKILDQYNVKATFFVTGNNSKYRYVITEASEQGHAIGLHSYTHNYAKIYKSQRAFFADLNRVQRVVKRCTGSKTYLLRFPGGSSNTVSKKYKKGIMTSLTDAAEERGYVYFDWNVDSEDASGTNVSVSRIVKNSTTVSSSEKYVNILMHCTSSKNTTVEALPKVIKYYKQRGYTFKALSEDSYTAHHPVYN